MRDTYTILRTSQWRTIADREAAARVIIQALRRRIRKDRIYAQANVAAALFAGAAIGYVIGFCSHG